MTTRPDRLRWLLPLLALVVAAVLAGGTAAGGPPEVTCGPTGCVSATSCDEHAGYGDCLPIPVPAEPTYTG